MEKVQPTENTVEVFENDIQMYLEMFCQEQEINNLRDISQAVWNAALMYVKRHVFPDRRILLSKARYNLDNNIVTSNFNQYNYDLVNDICDYYIYLCSLYDKEVSIIGFSNLTGISTDIIREWGHNHNKLSSSNFLVYKKLFEKREESLSNKLVSGKQNPVGVLGVLNRHYQWNLPGVSREAAGKKALTAADLPLLGTPEIVQIGQNGADQTDVEARETQDIVGNDI